MDKFIIIDGNSIINRTFYAIRMLTNKENIPTNAIYGFLNILFKILDEDNPSHIAVAFDLKEKTFRHLEYENYKAQRKGMPNELAVQMPILKEILCAMNIKTLEKSGYEADDIIGTISELCKNQSMECIIVTGDKDDLQLADEKTKIKLTTTRNGNSTTEIYDGNKVFEKYGITPTEFIDLKALMGDKSDNIPGVAGIGEVTALDLIKKYGSIEKIYQDIETLNIKETVKNKLVNDKEMAYLSKRLSTIDKNVPLSINFNECEKTEFNNQKLIEIFTRLEFKTFISRLSAKPQSNNLISNYNVIESKDAFEKIILNISKEFYYILFYNDKRLISMSFCFDEKNSYYIKLNDEMLFVLKNIFENKEILKIGSNIKDDIIILNSLGICFEQSYFDVSIAHYVLNPSKSSYEIDEIAFDLLEMSIPTASDTLSKNKIKANIEKIDREKAIDFATKNVLALIPIKKELENEIKKNEQGKLLYEVEMPLVNVLAQMQITGFRVDSEKLKEFSNILLEKLDNLTKNIYKLAGCEFNINSPKQLGEVLFERLNLPKVKKSKTGYSTDVEVLEKLSGKHEIIDSLLEFRKYAKLKSTYADGLYAVINTKTGKIHSSFKQTVTQTGRLSSTEPNLQNIPIKLDLGREIRKMFIASSDEYVLIDADYSQIELRILAHISDDQNMKNAFLNNEDIHTITASEVFNCSPLEVTPLMRSNAKAVNFGIVYGISDFSLSQDLGISKKEAKQYIDNYLENFSGVKEYMTNIVKKAKEAGFVTTILNRKRYLPELFSDNFITRSFGERMALNTPIQGSAADIIKIAMVLVYNELKTNNLKSRLILQVHDELIVEAHITEVDLVSKILKDKMENAISLSVPLIVDMNVGKSWYDAK